MPARGVYKTAESGTIAAGLAAGAIIWTYRNPEANTRPIMVQFMRPFSIVVVSFTTPVTAGRGLDLVRLTPDAPGTADPSGGSAWTAVKARSSSSESVGVGRIATTGALTTTGFTASAQLRKHDMSLGGNVNNATINTWKFRLEEENQVLLPGECLAFASTQLMDAVGTFRFQCDFSAVELPS